MEHNHNVIRFREPKARREERPSHARKVARALAVIESSRPCIRLAVAIRCATVQP